MFLKIKGLLQPAEIARLTTLGREATFVDGRVTNEGNSTKTNLQIARDIGDSRFRESVDLVTAALGRSREFREFAFPRRMTQPMLCRYDPGMRYGAHPDAPYLPFSSSGVMRTDLSATVFVADPKSYEGGELVIDLGSDSVSFKGDAGDAIVYPSTTLHEIRTVTAGTRLVSIVFIESMVADPTARTQLHQLNELIEIEGPNLSWESRMRLELVRNNLLRMFLSP